MDHETSRPEILFSGRAISKWATVVCESDLMAASTDWRKSFSLISGFFPSPTSNILREPATAGSLSKREEPGLPSISPFLSALLIMP